MGVPVIKEYGQEKTILKFFPYKGAACVVSATGVVADANGNKIVKAGTPWPSNDGNALGVLLHDVNVTNGDAPGTYVFEGVLDPDKLTANSITIDDAALAAMPKITIFGEPYSTSF